MIEEIHPISRGWVNDLGIGNPSLCFGYSREWVEKKVRRHLMRAAKGKGFRWKRWSNDDMRAATTPRQTAPRRTRTFDPLIKSQLLYQLS